DANSLLVEAAQRTRNKNVAENEKPHRPKGDPPHDPPPLGWGVSIGEKEEHERDGGEREKRDPTPEPRDEGSPRERTGLREQGVHDVVLAEAHHKDSERDPREQPADRVPW